MSNQQRSIQVPLPDELVQLCEAHGTTPETVLCGFIGDLCQLWGQSNPAMNSRGANERQAAWRWFGLIDWRIYRKTDSDPG